MIQLTELATGQPIAVRSEDIVLIVAKSSTDEHSPSIVRLRDRTEFEVKQGVSTVGGLISAVEP